MLTEYLPVFQVFLPEAGQRRSVLSWLPAEKKLRLAGVFSGCTAPIGAILGAVASQVAGSLLPFALAAAAGAMVYVVIEEVIPEANASGNGNAATVACIGGLCLVMSFSSLVG